MTERADHSPRDSPPPVVYRGKRLDFSRGPNVMGVLNVTPDSFYDGGRYQARVNALRRAKAMIAEGAAILDVGGESSRPGSDPVSAAVQKERVLPVIEAVREGWDGWISVDTCSGEVAQAAVEAGADMINDISAGRLDPGMKEVAAGLGVPCILMHMQGTPKTMQQRPTYEDVVREIVEQLTEWINLWQAAGVPSERLLLDPGVGFGKTGRHNLLILKHLHEFKALGRPIVFGTSRKSFLGTLLGREAEGRLAGSLATAAIGVLNGADILRVHDVSETLDVVRVVRAIREVRGRA